MNLDVYQVVDALRYASERLGLLNAGRKVDPDCPSYSSVQIFFSGVVESLKALQGHIKLEILHGDLMHELAKMRLGGDVSRPINFPRQYTRMWLSNVPYVLCCYTRC